MKSNGILNNSIITNVIGKNNSIEMNNYYYLLCISPVFLIFPYGQYRCSNKTFKDPLETKLGIPGLDGWSLAHIIFFMLLGYVFPETFIQTMTIGITWELFEHIYGKQRPGWLGGYGGACNNMATDREDGNWWYGKWSDIGCNAVGFIMGRYLATMI
jgi:hypothetical protein